MLHLLCCPLSDVTAPAVTPTAWIDSFLYYFLFCFFFKFYFCHRDTGVTSASAPDIFFLYFLSLFVAIIIIFCVARTFLNKKAGRPLPRTRSRSSSSIHASPTSHRLASNTAPSLSDPPPPPFASVHSFQTGFRLNGSNPFHPRWLGRFAYASRSPRRRRRFRQGYANARVKSC